MPLFGGLIGKRDGTREVKKVRHKHGSTRHTLRQSLKASLGQGANLREAVRCPEGENLNEWLAMNTAELFNTMNLCYGIVSEFCTDVSCPLMTAGPSVTYKWAENKKDKPIDLPAPVYIQHLSDWIFSQLSNPEIFPMDDGQPFGREFMPVLQKILSRMLRVYAHIYHCHWERVKTLGAEAHVNTCFKHFYFFISVYELVKSEELRPLQALLDRFNE